jgi:protein SERAC1
MANSKSFLRQIYPIDTNNTEAEVDVIAVHGLDPLASPLHATQTWSAANGNLWLRDFLPERKPRIRVFLYGYNSNAVFRASATGINGAAENLLNYLRLERQQDQERPIVWVSHSLGGLVVKKAIINAYISGDYYESIHDATRGVVFFGTPHRGGHHATLGDHMAKICRVVSGDVRNNIMEALRTDSMFAGDINKDFARRAKALELRVLNLIENLPIARHVGLVSVLFELHRSISNRWNLNPWWVPVAYLSRSSLQALPRWTGLSLQRFKSA